MKIKKQPKLNERKKVIKELPKEITMEQIYNYIGKLGSKNRAIQEIIYNQAVKQSESTEPKILIKEIYKILKR